MYTVRRLNIGKTEQLDELASASGELYSRVVVLFWRTVRKKGVWLKPSSLMRWQNSDRLHAHTADACAQAFFSSLKSYRARCKTDPDAKPPHERRKFFRVEYKSTAMRHKGDTLTLSNGRGNPPLVLPWTWETPKTLTIHWTGTQYEAIAVYVLPEPKLVQDGRTAGVDLGEIHLAVSHDGDHTHIINGRLLRAKRQYQNRIKARLSHMIDTKKRGSRRRERLIQSKKRQLRKLDNQIKDITHKCTTRLVSTLREDGVQTVVIGDVRDIRQGLDYGKKANQKIHQWLSGKARWYITYKSQRQGMKVALQDESYTSQDCPVSEHRNKPRGRQYSCKCGFRFHRDGVGAINIRRKYLGFGRVIGDMAPPTGWRYHPHACVARRAA